MMPSIEQLSAHPELALLSALELQLDMLLAVFAAAHRGSDTTALRDQARAMTRVGQVLAAQIRVYENLIQTADSFTPTGGR